MLSRKCQDVSKYAMVLPNVLQRKLCLIAVRRVVVAKTGEACSLCESRTYGAIVMKLSSYRSNDVRLEPEECSTTVQQPWYALKVRTRSEHIASTALQNRGYEPFLPSYKETKRFCDRTKTLERPAFPGYMFCRFGASSRAQILSSPAILYIVSFAGQPAIVPAETIEAVRRAVAAGGQPSKYMPAGLQVRITSGPLAGLEGVLLRTGKHNRIVVSVHLLQRSVAINVSRDCLHEVPPPKV